MNYSGHARDQMQRRGIDEDDVERTVNANYYVATQPNSRRVYVRRYGNRGMRFVVHMSADGSTVVTVRRQSRPYMGV